MHSTTLSRHPLLLIVKGITLLQWVAAQKCPIEIRVYRSLDDCKANSSNPSAAGRLFADEICHTTEVLFSNSTNDEALLPGQYTLKCTADENGQPFAEFVSSAGCTPGPKFGGLGDRESKEACQEFRRASPAALYSFLRQPALYRVQNGVPKNAGGSEYCTVLSSCGMSVSFALFSDCLDTTRCRLSADSRRELITSAPDPYAQENEGSTGAPAATPADRDAPVASPADTEAPVASVPDTNAPVASPVDTEAPVASPVDTEAPVGSVPDTDAPVASPLDTEAPVPSVPDTDSPVANQIRSKAPFSSAPSARPVNTRPRTTSPADTKAPTTRPVSTAAPVASTFDTDAPAANTDTPDAGTPDTNSPTTTPTRTIDALCHHPSSTSENCVKTNAPVARPFLSPSPSLVTQETNAFTEEPTSYVRLESSFRPSVQMYESDSQRPVAFLVVTEAPVQYRVDTDAPAGTPFPTLAPVQSSSTFDSFHPSLLNTNTPSTIQPTSNPASTEPIWSSHPTLEPTVTRFSASESPTNAPWKDTTIQSPETGTLNPAPEAKAPHTPTTSGIPTVPTRLPGIPTPPSITTRSPSISRVGTPGPDASSTSNTGKPTPKPSTSSRLPAEPSAEPQGTQRPASTSETTPTPPIKQPFSPTSSNAPASPTSPINQPVSPTSSNAPPSPQSPINQPVSPTSSNVPQSPTSPIQPSPTSPINQPVSPTSSNVPQSPTIPIIQPLSPTTSNAPPSPTPPINQPVSPTSSNVPPTPYTPTLESGGGVLPSVAPLTNSVAPAEPNNGAPTTSVPSMGPPIDVTLSGNGPHGTATPYSSTPAPHNIFRPAPPNVAPGQAPSSKGSRKHAGIIVSSTIAAFMVLLAAIAIIYVYRKRRQRPPATRRYSTTIVAPNLGKKEADRKPGIPTPNTARESMSPRVISLGQEMDDVSSLEYGSVVRPGEERNWKTPGGVTDSNRVEAEIVVSPPKTDVMALPEEIPKSKDPVHDEEIGASWPFCDDQKPSAVADPTKTQKRVDQDISASDAANGVAPIVELESCSGKASVIETIADEHLIDVEVPAGHFDLILDVSEGVPEVHSVQADSALVDQVRIGDRLVAVDGVDISSLSPTDLLQLMDLRLDTKRVLTFIRQ